MAGSDILNAKGEQIDKEAIKVNSIEEALLFAQNDLKNKWEFYKNRFLKQINNDKKGKNKPEN